MSEREILLKAADVIDERGWHQDGFVPVDGDLSTCPVCVLGAISVAAGCSPVMDETELGRHHPGVAAAMEFARYLDLKVGDHHDLIELVGDEWNDEVAKSAEQVTAALRECAAELPEDAS